MCAPWHSMFQVRVRRSWGESNASRQITLSRWELMTQWRLEPKNTMFARRDLPIVFSTIYLLTMRIDLKNWIIRMDQDNRKNLRSSCWLGSKYACKCKEKGWMLHKIHCCLKEECSWLFKQTKHITTF